LKLPADVRIEAQPKPHPLCLLDLLDLALYLYCNTINYTALIAPPLYIETGWTKGQAKANNRSQDETRGYCMGSI
jgi:hypothetical protein